MSTAPIDETQRIDHRETVTRIGREIKSGETIDEIEETTGRKAGCGEAVLAIGRRWLALAALLLCAGWLAACSVQPETGATQPAGWQYADLRLVEADDPLPPDQDLLAIYARPEGADLRLRVDLLDLAALPESDLAIAVDSRPGGTTSLPGGGQAQIAWDALLLLPANGELAALRADGTPLPGSALFVLRNPQADFIEIWLRRSALDWPASGEPRQTWPVQLQVFSMPTGGEAIADRMAPARSDAAPPEPARALLVFWNAYPAYTPITALRRWDGAHTGPLGGRHGLYNLLRTAQAAAAPLTLLDLNAPAALSALDYAGGLGLVQEMAQGGLLALPLAQTDPAYGPFPATPQSETALLEQGWEAAAAFGLPASHSAYRPPDGQSTPAAAKLLFERSATVSTAGFSPADLLLWLPAPDAARRAVTLGWPAPQRRGGQTVIPLPGEFLQPAPNQAYAQAGREGLELDWRRLLARTAVNCAGQGCYLPLGGDLPASTWGDPQAARATLRWMKAHPWVQLVRAEELAELAQRGDWDTAQAPPAAAPEGVEMARALEQAPQNRLGWAAWQAYAALFAPVYPRAETLPELRAGYTGQVWGLINAAEWAQSNGQLQSQQGSTAYAGGMAGDGHSSSIGTRCSDPPRPSNLAGSVTRVAQAPSFMAAGSDDGCLGDPGWSGGLTDAARWITPTWAYAGGDHTMWVAPTWETQIDCDGDPDRDGAAECVLANEAFYAQIEIDDGTLSGLYGRNAQAVHQIVGPSWQFISGLSDPQSWQIGAGTAAEPAAIPGAFSGPGNGYRAEVHHGALLLSSPDGAIHKLYQLTGRGLHVEYRVNGGTPAAAKIPLALDPWLRFEPGWHNAYSARTVAGGWEVQGGGLRVLVLSEALARLASFQDSAALFPGPEDPNREFPAGHLLPFPLQVLEVNIPASAGQVSIDIIPVR